MGELPRATGIRYRRQDKNVARAEVLYDERMPGREGDDDALPSDVRAILQGADHANSR